MARKGKVKLKRGKVKFKLKSDDDVLLHGGDHIRALIEAAMESAVAGAVPVVTSRVLTDRPDPRALPTADRPELPPMR